MLCGGHVPTHASHVVPSFGLSPPHPVVAPLKYQDKPVLFEEGMMTLLRKNVVSNARLIKCADGRGLRVRNCKVYYRPDAIFTAERVFCCPNVRPPMVEACLGLTFTELRVSHNPTLSPSSKAPNIGCCS